MVFNEKVSYQRAGQAKCRPDPHQYAEGRGEGLAQHLADAFLFGIRQCFRDCSICHVTGVCCQHTLRFGGQRLDRGIIQQQLGKPGDRQPARDRLRQVFFPNEQSVVDREPGYRRVDQAPSRSDPHQKIECGDK